MGNTFSSAEKELDIDKTAKQIDKTTKQLFNKNKEVSFLENHPTEKTQVAAAPDRLYSTTGHSIRP